MWCIRSNYRRRTEVYYVRRQTPGSVDTVHGITLEMAGWSSWSARKAHNLEVVGSNPIPAPIET